MAQRTSLSATTAPGVDTQLVTLDPSDTPAAPPIGTLVYAKTDGQVYLRAAGGDERMHAPMTISDTAPANPKVGDRWLATNVAAAVAPARFAVGDNDPGLTEAGMWVQTGLGPNGTGITFWIEDGT